MPTVAITPETLNQLRMLSDWQLREAGYDPESVTSASLDFLDQSERWGGRNPHDEEKDYEADGYN